MPNRYTFTVPATPPAAIPESRRLCYVADAGSVHTQRWCRHFADAGWEVHVFSLRPATMPGVAVHLLRPWWSGKSGYLTTLPRLRQMLRQLRPDLVHAHYLTSYGLLAVLAGGRPLIISVWGSDIQDFPHRSPLHRGVVRWILRQADRVLATSAVLADQAKALLPPGTEVAVTPFGVDTTCFMPGEAPPTSATPVIGAVGNLVPEKGFDLLLIACAQLLKVAPDRPLTVAIIGDGPQRAALELQAERLGLRGRITWHGAVAPEQLPALYRTMTVVAMPSRRESFGVVALEAAACGRPVVATSVGGLPETVADGVSGLLVTPEDPVALALALARLLQDADLRERLGKAGRERAVRLFDWHRTAAQMADVYDTCPKTQGAQKDGERA
ncbi:MAG: glycosyltransferase [Candidatus Sericytochromatia bacterium]|nr:glycosyltransferase [Candidatus Sericytochromatia bacterium]